MISRLAPAVLGATFPVPDSGIDTVCEPLTRYFPVHLPFASSCLGMKRSTSARDMVNAIEDPAPEARHDAVAGVSTACVCLTAVIGWPRKVAPFSWFGFVQI